ncbi:MAG: hypothetical protein DRJ18_00685 [Candidatus Methanomethylicota archaeon]|nr:MAG: hypothetical protein DRJ18_00685 [Candidatus Verstraetearchaeota archaeon]
MKEYIRSLGCVLWLEFREPGGDIAYDLSGKGNHGKIYGAKRRGYHFLQGLEFDGEDDYGKVPYSDTLKPWAGFTATIVCKPLDVVTQSNPISQDISPPGNRCWQLAVMGRKWRLAIQGPSGPHEYYSPEIAKSKFTFLAVQYDPDALAARLWADGEYVIDEVLPEAMNQHSPDLILANLGDLNWPCKCIISQVQYFSAVLTESEIKALYNYVKPYLDWLNKYAT